MKNPFKLNSALSSAAAVAVGGGANVLADWAIAKMELSEEYKKYVDGAKVVVGAVGSSMISNKGKYGWLKSAMDGIAIVGASNIISGLVNPVSGLPEGTIGRIRLGQRGFRGGKRVAGLGGANFMEA